MAFFWLVTCVRARSWARICPVNPLLMSEGDIPHVDVVRGDDYIGAQVAVDHLAFRD
jgi:hypothetical protein